MDAMVPVFGWALAIASSVAVWPQAIRALRTRDVTGLSLLAAMAGACTVLAWCAYTLAIGDLPAFGSSVGPLAAWLVVLAVMCSVGIRGARRCVAAIVALALAVVMLLALLGRDVVGWIGVLASIGSIGWALPQLWTALRRSDLSGVSVLAFGLIALESLGWLAYAALTQTPAYVPGSAVQLVAAAVIALQAARAHRRNRPGHLAAVGAA
jgi:uncharacterized protein with PQ loop repeat